MHLKAETKRFIVEFFSDSALVFRVSDNKLLEVDSTGRTILKFLLTGLGINNIVSLLNDEYDVGLRRLEEDVEAFVSHIATFGLDQTVLNAHVRRTGDVSDSVWETLIIYGD